MTNRYFAALLLTLAVTLLGRASDGYGWSKLPLFSYEISSIVQTKDKVYYVSGQSLFSFDETTQETYCYDSLNKLTGENVTAIFYNDAEGFLLVAYDDGNLDVIYDDGSLINLPEIRDASLIGSKRINDVAYGQGFMLLGTDFGIVVYDLKKMEVRESGIFNVPVTSVAIEADKMLIVTSIKPNVYIYTAPLEGRHNNLSKFKQLGGGLLTDLIRPLSDSRYLLHNYLSGEFYIRTANADMTNWAGNTTYLGVRSNHRLKHFKGGLYTSDDKGLIIFDADGVRSITLPDDLQGQLAAIYDTPAKMWLADDEGIAKYDLSDPSSPEMLYDKALPAGITTVSEVGYMRWSADGKRLYVVNYPYSIFRSWSVPEGSDIFQTMNIIEDGQPRDASLMDATAEHKEYGLKWQQLHGNKRMYGDPKGVVEDPDDPDIHYCPTNFEGLYVIKYNKETGEYEEIGRFTDKNSPMTNASGYRVEDVSIDPQGNLWMGCLGDVPYYVLPADKRRKHPSEITAADWKVASHLPNDVIKGKDMRVIFCRKSNMAFFINGHYEGYITALDTKGTYDDFTDDAVYTWTRYTDQDGLTFEPPLHTTFSIEDNRGCVWFGTSQGIFEFSNPSQATNPAMKVRRIKVPRNDGTEYADYLLGSDMIYWIGLDPAGRKWVATESSGLFLVSESGDKILRNFTADNSPLPTNRVTSVECDPQSNKVYVGTTQGLYSFLSDATPGMNDLSDILAYPNPVRPEYTGEVTITGLMDNSIVKIADAQGNVIYQTRSQAGMATWNPYTASGSRVRTGVYFIYVTSSDGAKQLGNVSKVMVIN